MNNNLGTVFWPGAQESMRDTPYYIRAGQDLVLMRFNKPFQIRIRSLFPPSFLGDMNSCLLAGNAKISLQVSLYIAYKIYLASILCLNHYKIILSNLILKTTQLCEIRLMETCLKRQASFLGPGVFLDEHIRCLTYSSKSDAKSSKTH